MHDSRHVQVSYIGTVFTANGLMCCIGHRNSRALDEAPGFLKRVLPDGLPAIPEGLRYYGSQPNQSVSQSVG